MKSAFQGTGLLVQEKTHKSQLRIWSFLGPPFYDYLPSRLYYSKILLRQCLLSPKVITKVNAVTIYEFQFHMDTFQLGAVFLGFNIKQLHT